MPPKRSEVCACCGLKYLVDAYGNGRPDRFCGVCRTHQSPAPEQVLKKHREHEDMLRVRLAKSSTWAATAEVEVKEVRQQVYWAYRSRDKPMS